MCYLFFLNRGLRVKTSGSLDYQRALCRGANKPPRHGERWAVLEFISEQSPFPLLMVSIRSIQYAQLR